MENTAPNKKTKQELRNSPRATQKGTGLIKMALRKMTKRSGRKIYGRKYFLWP